MNKQQWINIEVSFGRSPMMYIQNHSTLRNEMMFFFLFLTMKLRQQYCIGSKPLRDRHVTIDEMGRNFSIICLHYDYQLGNVKFINSDIRLIMS